MKSVDPQLDALLAVSSLAFQRIGAGAAVLDSKGVIVATNEAWRLFTRLNSGVARTTGSGVNYLEVCDRAAANGAEDAARVADGLRQILDGERDSFDAEYPCPSPMEDRWFRLQASAAPVDAGAGVVLFHIDITARVLLAERLLALADDDTLTGLPNRRFALRFLSQQLEIARASESPISVLFLDLDRFKTVNDRYGHHAGDELLIKISIRCNRIVRRQDRLCRLGGDEFLLICPGLDAVAAAALAERLRTVISESFQIGTAEVATGVSVGCSTGSSDSTVDALINAADADMYADKCRRGGPRAQASGAALAAAGTTTPATFAGKVYEDSDDVRRRALGLHTEVADAVIVTDLDEFRIQSFNRAAEDLYGWSSAEVLGHHLNEINPWIGTEEDRLSADRQLHAEGRWHGELTVQCRNGSKRRVLGSTTLVRDPDGVPIGAVIVNRLVPNRPHTRRSSLAETLDIERQIRRGIANNEFVVHYQPIVRLADDEVIGVEALVRWQHPARGLLLPASFIDVAEQSGCIVELGQHVLESACRQAQVWRAGGRDLQLAVNLSGLQLGDDQLPERLASVLDETMLPAERLWIEITETTLVQDLDKATLALRRIRDLGVAVSIDDFGTGWASLTYLRQFPVNALKVDVSFVAGVGLRPRDTAIVHSIISLADELGISVVAEGIETPRQRRTLLRMGCERGQGYLFGRPAPAG